MLTRKKTFLYLIGSLIFVLIGLFGLGAVTFVVHSESKVTDWSRLIFIGIISLAAILFFGFTFFFYLFRIFSRKPSIILNDEGIMDNSTFGSTGLIKWEDIKEVKIYDFEVKNQYGECKQKFLGIVPKDFNKLIESKKWVKNKFLRLNQNYVGAPINIPQNIIKISLEDLEKEIKKRLRSYNKKN